ncbi:MAG: hypothetical protein AAFY07_06775 [Pseudomonadota bacterium]
MTYMLSLVTPAHATPPSVITIEDRPFGLSENELFVLRTTSDNLGTYTRSRYETYLVAISLETGTQTLWHIETAQFGVTADNHPGVGDDEARPPPMIVTHQPAFRIMANRDGLFWGAVSQIYFGTLSKPTLSVDKDVLTVSGNNRPSFSIRVADALAYVTSSAQKIATNVPDYWRFEPISTRDQFGSMALEDAKCNYAVADLAGLPGATRLLQLVRVECLEKELETTRYSFLVPITAPMHPPLKDSDAGRDTVLVP